MTAICLTEVTLATFDPVTVERGAIRIEDGRIVEKGPTVTPKPGDEVLALPGRVVTPALVVAHHHLYSALARGMPGPAEPPRTFIEILERVWWVLDRTLGPESVELSGLVGLIGALRCGAGAVVDHHASPWFIYGSLDRVASAFEQTGLRGVLCYEASDRWGEDHGRQGVEENLRFARQVAGNEMLAAAIGAHASFTLSDGTFQAIADAVGQTGTGIHIHVLEDEADRTLSQQRWGQDPISRLERFGLLDERALLAHGVHLSDDEIDRVAKSQAMLLHNPRSNMNNAVGKTPLGKVMTRGVRLALGTDGIDGDVITEVRSAFFRSREEAEPPPFDGAVRMLGGGHAILNQCFGSGFGSLEPGAAADLTLFAYDPPTPLTAENLAGHVIFGGLGPETVESVMVAGRFLMQDRTILVLDEQEVLARARKAAAGLWTAMQEMAGQGHG
ncbi:MAG: putative aminohydrolase SsnA [Deltaproteobacteria bacterium]|nr:putative aminohydrolase SsnA [Deltaproteobacteria bacterium]